jgi:hypothetical protein
MNMLKLHPEFLRKNGKAEFVVLPYKEFVALQELAEDADDLLVIEQAKYEDAGELGVALDDMKRRLGME